MTLFFFILFVAAVALTVYHISEQKNKISQREEEEINKVIIAEVKNCSVCDGKKTRVMYFQGRARPLCRKKDCYKRAEFAEKVRVIGLSM